MNIFFNWHIKYINWCKKKLSLTNYSLWWIAFIKGLIIGLLIYHFFINNEAQAQTIKVIDADTIILDGEKIRFSGIDAPETNFKGKKPICQLNNLKIFCGNLSKIVLIEKISNKKIFCERETNKDIYKRTLAECFVENKSLSSFLVRSGYAFDYTKYSKKKYAEDEKYAKNNKLGIWTMEFEYPWVWREKIK